LPPKSFSPTTCWGERIKNNLKRCPNAWRFRVRPGRATSISGFSQILAVKPEDQGTFFQIFGAYPVIFDALMDSNTALLYGGGFRLIRRMRLGVRDFDFENHQIIVRGGKGGDDRFTLLPDSAVADVKHLLQDVKVLHEQDLRHVYGEAARPNTLGVKYKMLERNGDGNTFSRTASVS
jgi:integrase